jgi:hypothetical protein
MNMNEYCLTAAEAAEQTGIEMADLKALIAGHPQLAVEVNGAQRIAPAQLAAVLGTDAILLAA